MERIKLYIRLTKPGVLMGNVLTAAAGYLLAAAGAINWTVFVAMLIGQTLVIGAACALNNLLDQDIDAQMQRTKRRPSVTGALSSVEMILVVLVLAVSGFAVLLLYTPLIVSIVGVVGFVTYVWLYGALSKRQSIHGTLVGSISGALPIVGGYVAARGTIDSGALVVFLIMYFWQFPEFFSIALYRLKEYKRAGIPVMPVVVGRQNTVVQIIIYTALYVLSTISLSLLGYTGWIYFAVMLVTGLLWFWFSLKGIAAKGNDEWARSMFRLSMYTILLLCVMLPLGPILP